MPSDLIRVTITLPDALYRRARARTENFSAFAAAAIEWRLRNEDLVAALGATRGLLAETLRDVESPEDIVALLHEEREGWNRHAGRRT